MAFDNMDDLDMDMGLEEEEVGGPLPEEASNRTFVIVAGVLGAIMVLSLVCVAIYAFVVLPQTRSSKATQAAQLEAQNTAMALEITQTSVASKWTATPRPTNTPVPATNTPVVVQATSTSTPIIDAVATTQAALYTQVAQAQLTQVTPPTYLPTSGFFDDVVTSGGVPGLLALAAVLVVVIFLARRLRTAA